MAIAKINMARFGTETSSAQPEPVVLGPLSVLIDSSGIRQLSWNNTEVLRGLIVAVRDANWGNAAAEDIQQDISCNECHFSLKRHACYFAGALETELTLSATNRGELTAKLTLTAHRDVQLNRAGFSLLHPLQGVSGQPLTIVHKNGSQQTTGFPAKITPSQPALDIVSMRHQIDGIDVTINFEGEVFEMEDQRNWSDASFKTYCRPLALPFPYTLAKGETVQQSVRILLGNAKATASAANAETAKFVKRTGAPEILLASQSDWQNTQSLPALGILARFETGANIDPDYLTSLNKKIQQSGAYLDAEIVVSDGDHPAKDIAQIAMQLNAANITPRHVIALPIDYLKSHQPSGPRPDGATPKQCADAVTTAFPNSQTGVGMLTNFTEFNRCPPADGIGGYITHGNAAIVHAADDMSVLQTLETLPQIFASAQALSGGRDYRLGLVSIGMRGNPYGASLNDNAKMQRMTMTADDPRQQGIFAAAYAIGVATMVAQSGIDAVALAATAGPFSMTNDDLSLRPIYHAIKALSTISGQAVTPLFDLPSSIIGLSFEGGMIVANCGLNPVSLDCPHDQVAILNVATFDTAAQNPDWIKMAEKAVGKTVTLEPFDCLFSGVKL